MAAVALDKSNRLASLDPPGAALRHEALRAVAGSEATSGDEVLHPDALGGPVAFAHGGGAKLLRGIAALAARSASNGRSRLASDYCQRRAAEAVRQARDFV